MQKISVIGMPSQELVKLLHSLGFEPDPIIRQDAMPENVASFYPPVEVTRTEGVRKLRRPKRFRKGKNRPHSQK